MYVREIERKREREEKRIKTRQREKYKVQYIHQLNAQQVDFRELLTELLYRVLVALWLSSKDGRLLDSHGQG